MAYEETLKLVTNSIPRIWMEVVAHQAAASDLPAMFEPDLEQSKIVFAGGVVIENASFAFLR